MEAAEGYVALIRCTRAFGPELEEKILRNKNAAKPGNVVLLMLETSRIHREPGCESTAL